MNDSTLRLRPALAPLGLSLSLACLALSGCDTPDDRDASELVSAEELPAAGDVRPALDDVEIVERAPDLVLELDGGATLGFMIDADGVGMVEKIPAGAGVASVLDDPWLRDASPAVVWYALTKEGVEIPAELRAHHEELAQLGELAPLEEALAAQDRDLAPVPLADGTSPCLNSTFNANHCAHASYDDYLCRFNASGNLTWNVVPARRYKAGFCLQAGSAESTLTYAPSAGSYEGECLYFQIFSAIWGYDQNFVKKTYLPTTYFTYAWWGAPGGFRAFYHNASGNTGAVYDFGNRYSTHSCG